MSRLSMLDEKIGADTLEEREDFFNKLSAKDEKKLQDHFIEEREYGGIPIMKDNCEDLFENWLECEPLFTFKKILYV